MKETLERPEKSEVHEYFVRGGGEDRVHRFWGVGTSKLLWGMCVGFFSA